MDVIASSRNDNPVHQSDHKILTNNKEFEEENSDSFDETDSEISDSYTESIKEIDGNKKYTEFRYVNKYIICTVVSSSLCYFIGYNSGSILYLFLILASAVYIYKLQVRRREAALTKMFKDLLKENFGKNRNGESCDWVNNLISSIWRLINPELLITISDMIEDNFNSLSPGIVQGAQIRDFQLGSIPLELSNIKNLTKTVMMNDNEILGELDFKLFALPTTKNRHLSPPHILIDLMIGVKGIAKKIVPVKVEWQSIIGKAKLKIKIMDNLPFLDIVDFSFTKLPRFNAAIYPLKSVNIMKTPLFSQYIKNGLNSSFEQYVEPRYLRVDLKALLTGDDQWYDTLSTGVVKIELTEAIGLIKNDLKIKRDAYVTFQVRDNKFLSVSRTENKVNPRWIETHYILVNKIDVENDLDLEIKIWDTDRLGKNCVLGVIKYNLRTIVEGLEKEKIIFDGQRNLNETNSKYTGQLKHKVTYHPKTEFKKQQSSPECSIMTCVLYQASDLDITDKIYNKNITIPDPYAVIYINDKPFFRTKTKLSNPSPYWNAVKDVFVKDWHNVSIKVVVKAKMMYESNPVIGVCKIKVPKNIKSFIDPVYTAWYNLEGGIGNGKIRFGVLIKPIYMKLPKELSGYDLGSLCISKLTIKDMIQSEQKELVKKEELFCVFKLSDTDEQKEIKMAHEDVYWKLSDLALKINNRYNESLLIIVKRKTTIISSDIIGCFTLSLNQLIDNKFRVFTQTLHSTKEAKVDLRSILGILEPSKEKADEITKHTINIKIGFIPGISQLHYKELGEDFLGLNLTTLIEPPHLKWKQSLSNHAQLDANCSPVVNDQNISSFLTNSSFLTPATTAKSNDSEIAESNQKSVFSANSNTTIRSIKWTANKLKNKLKQTVTKKPHPHQSSIDGED